MVKHKLLHNIGALTFLQLFNYIAPLLLLPYLSRTLEVKEFGVVMVAMSSVFIGFVITDYGFSISATFRVSNNRSNIDYINKLISRIFCAKILLIMLAMIVNLGVSLMPTYSEYREVFWAGMISIMAQAYQPLWLFQGLERMKNYVLYMVSIKLLYIILVLVVVNNHGDGKWVLLSWSVANVIGMLISLYMLHSLGYKIGLVSINKALSELKDSGVFFISRLAVVAYTSACSIIVGAVNLNQVSYYVAAEQGYKAGQVVSNSINQALYPYMAKEHDWKTFYKFLLVGFILVTVGAILVGNFAGFFLEIVFGSGYRHAEPILKIMMATLVLNYLAVSFGYPALGALNNNIWANKSVIYGSIFFFFIALSVFLVGIINAINMSIMVLMTELFVFILRFMVFYKNKRDI